MLKHNKKKNAGIVYEQLVSVVTRLAVTKKKEEAGFVLGLIKEHYAPGTELAKEKKLFESLNKKLNCSNEDAENIILEAIEESKLINESKLEKEKLALIQSINKNISSDLYNIPFKDFKKYASIQILFNESRNGFQYTTPKERVKIKKTLIKEIVDVPNIEGTEKIDNFTFKILLEKFNKKYGKLMNEDQKDLLRHYILTLVNEKEEANFAKLLVEKIEKIKKTLIGHKLSEKHKGTDYEHMINEAQETVSKLTEENLNEELIYKVMRFFDVCEDLNEVLKEAKE